MKQVVTILCVLGAWLAYGGEAGRGKSLWYNQSMVKGQKDYHPKIHKIIWNRRCIENYLISKSARQELSSAVTESTMREKWKLPANSLASNLTRYRESYIGHVKNVGDLFFDSDFFNDQSVCVVNCKSVVHSFISDENGFNTAKLAAYVEKMGSSEVDPYLIQVFDKIHAEATST